MPVVMNGPGPTVNYIGMSPEERAKQMHNQRERERSFARTLPPTVKLISPEGVEEEVLRDNMRDYIRLRGYVEVPKQVKPKAEAEAEAEEAPVDDAVKIAVAREAEIESAVNDIEALRDELKTLGVEVDQRWGKRRLLAELADARAAKTE